jgi:predicted DNA-binding transcriptional regulator AlpA
VRLTDLDKRAKNWLLAYVGVVHGVLVALIPSTAIGSDLPHHEGDRTRAPRNGATEFVLEVIVDLPRLEVIAVPRLDRLLRRVGFQGLVLDALREHDVNLLVDSGLRDLMDSSQMTLTSIEGTITGDVNAITLKKHTIGGRIGALSPGEGGVSGRDFNYSHCPPGYKPLWCEKPDGARVPVKGSIVLNPVHAQAIKAGWTMFAGGATRREIGDAVAGLGWPMRDGSGRTLADLSSKGRATVMYYTLTRGLAELHRTGTWQQQRSASAPIREAGGHDLERRADGRRAVTIMGRLEVFQVDGLPWGVPLAVWDDVAARFERETRETAKEWGGRWSTQLMHYSPPFWTDGSWHRFMKEHTTLQLRSIPGGSAKEAVEWDEAFTTLVASCSFNRVWRRIGVELLCQLALAGAGVQELALTPGTETGTVRTLRADLGTTLSRAEAATEAATDAGDLAQTAQHDGNLAAAAAQLARQEGYLMTARQMDARSAALKAELQRALAQDLDQRADLRSPLGVGAALSRWDGAEDLVLRSALEQLGIVATMRGGYDARTGEIHLVAEATIGLSDGTEVELPLEVRLANTSNRREEGAEAPSLVLAWAAGATLEDLAAKLGRTPLWARRTLDGWFAAHRVDTMVTALQDCPVLVTRQAVVATVAPDLLRMPSRTSAGTKLTAATISLLVSPYVDDRGGTWKAWAGMEHAGPRRVVAVLRAAGGEADAAAIEAAAGADPFEVSKPFGNRPPLILAPRRGRRRLRRCPHADCPSAWASHVLYVPETAEYGCICPVCLRVPDLGYADAPLPAEYATKWELSRVDAIMATTRSTAAQLVLPDVKLARMAGELVRPLEVAQILGVTLGTVAPLRHEGKLPQAVVCGKTSLWRRSELQALALQRATASVHAIKDGLLSPSQAAARLGVPDHRLRQYCRDGLLAYRVPGGAHRGRIRIRPEIVAAFVPPPGDLIRAMKVEEVMRKTGLTRAVILRAIESGELDTVLPSSGHRRVTPEALTAWLSRHPKPPRTAIHPPTGDVGITRDSLGELSVSAAAALLQLSPKQVRRLADQGVLNDHRAERGDWRWFDVTEVVALAAMRKHL